jgi:hypothetical protein
LTEPVTRRGAGKGNITTMKAASVKEIKQELETVSPAKLLELVMRLTKFKKENKELLTYLLFEAHDEQGYISGIKETLHLMFTDVNVKSLYITKKNLRKIIRIANRFIKYSDDPVTEVEILLYICEEIQQLGIDLKKSTALQNIYTALLKKIEKNIALLHEDLQYDYLKELNKIAGK